ncbi:MAG: nucleoside triphosphate pyrophosphohydrolase, partial [Actinobacteria bacterium]
MARDPSGERADHAVRPGEGPGAEAGAGERIQRLGPAAGSGGSDRRGSELRPVRPHHPPGGADHQHGSERDRLTGVGFAHLPAVMIGDPADHVPAGPVPSSRGGTRLLDLVKVQARLREPDGCPWDREQTHRTLARHLLEETHELLEAIDADDDAAVRDELGDLLLQVTFHAQIAADEGRWDIDDVAEGLIRKLIHRHPHVFGDVDVAGSDEVLVNWEKLKAEEDGGRKGVDDGIPETLPALARAAKVQRRAAGWGFEWRSVPGAIGALREELDELEEATSPEDAEGEVGDVLFATV